VHDVIYTIDIFDVVVYKNRVIKKRGKNMCTKFKSYKEYCADRSKNGFQVIPETLWVALNGEM